MRVALIDGDIVAYRCACSIEDIPTLVELAAMDKNIDDRESLITYEPVQLAFARIDNLIDDILRVTDSTEQIIYISGEHDFRKTVNPEYKANRKDLRRPRFLQQCNEYLVTQWNATVTDGIEADDALGIKQTQLNKDEHDSIICTIDKDLLQIKGDHYNFVTGEFKKISATEGEKFLWKQMIIGDTSDNIFGIKGMGKVAATKLIDPLNSTEEMYWAVYNLYDDHERFEKNYKCLKILSEQ